MAKGKLVIVGGAEDKGEDRQRYDSDIAVDDYYENGILRRIVDESVKKEKSRIEILTTASLEAEELGNDYKKAFARLDANNSDIMNITTREEAYDEKFLKRLKAADIVMVTGGDQMRLTSILGGTPFLSMLHDKYEKEDFVYAGSSAGAASASNNIVDGRCIKDSNFNDIDDGEAISIENVVLHVMSKYDIYDLKKDKLNIDHRNNDDEK